MKRSGLAIAAFVALSSAGASAGTYEFQYAGTDTSAGPFSAQLFITTPALGDPATAISGDRNGIMVTGLSSFAFADNILLGTAPFVDFSGLSYTIVGGTAYTVGASGGIAYEANSVNDPGGVLITTAAVTSSSVSLVPEPASLAVVSVGLLGLGFAYRKRPVGFVA